MPKTFDSSLFDTVQNHWQDILRTMQISREMLRGFRTLRGTIPCVTIFGSSRFDQQHPYCMLAEDVARTFGEAGFNIMTGGGPGIMEAANRGAKKAGVQSLGCTIQLPVEQKPNAYLDTRVDFNHFYARKVMLVKFSCAFIILPGGFGTLDEIFETLNLIETQKIERFPLVIMGSDYWTDIGRFIQQTMIGEKTVSADDIDRYLTITDDPGKALHYVQDRIPGGLCQGL